MTEIRSAVVEGRRTVAGLLLLLSRGRFAEVDLLLGQTDAAGTEMLVRVLIRELLVMHRGVAAYLDADLDAVLAADVANWAGGRP